MTKPTPRRAILRAAVVIAVPAAIVTAAAPQKAAAVPDDPLDRRASRRPTPPRSPTPSSS